MWHGIIYVNFRSGPLEFVEFDNGRFGMLRDGTTVNPGSMRAGVDKFATVTHPAAGAPCDPAVQKCLDRIESQIRLGTNSRGRRHCVT